MINLTRKKISTDFPEEFLYREKTITDLKDIANSFSEYFSNIGPSLSKKIDMSGNDMTYNDYLENSAHSRFSFSSVSEKETLKIIVTTTPGLESGSFIYSHELR